MQPRRPALLTLLAAPLLVAFPLLVAGCGSGNAGATNAATPPAPAPSPPRTEVAAPPSTDTAMAGNAAQPKANPTKRIPLKPGAKTVVLARAGDRSYDKTFDDMRFDIKPGQPFHRDMLPSEIEALAGQRIRIRGYILPTPQKRGIKEFVLVRDNQECCFGPGAALYDCILVEMKEGTTAEYSIRPVAVEGIFGINEIKSGDVHLAIYRLDAESVQ